MTLVINNNRIFMSSAIAQPTASSSDNLSKTVVETKVSKQTKDNSSTVKFTALISGLLVSIMGLMFVTRKKHQSTVEIKNLQEKLTNKLQELASLQAEMSQLQTTKITNKQTISKLENKTQQLQSELKVAIEKPIKIAQELYSLMIKTQGNLDEAITKLTLVNQAE